jgi:hypothetical protein
VITHWAELRALATLRRIAKAMERANDLELHRQQMEYPPISRAEAPKRNLDISHPTAQAWNERQSMKKAGLPDAT